jgi:hypothetical protein
VVRDSKGLVVTDIEQFCDASMKNGAQFSGDANRQTKPVLCGRGFSHEISPATIKFIILQNRSQIMQRKIILTWANSTKEILVECTLSPRSLNRETCKGNHFSRQYI